MNNVLLKIGVVVTGSLLLLAEALAHQPVMDMAPRWEDGYGLQLRHEWYGSDELLDGDSTVSNPLNRGRYVHRTWLEGVYTFDRSKRLTFKLPQIHQRRRVIQDGVAVTQKGEGLGDLVLGLPLKLYENRKRSTHNFSLTPSLRVPTGSSSGSFPVGDGSWDLGLSLSYSSEDPFWYQLYDLYYWVNTDGAGGRSEGDELGLDINLGIHPYHSNESNSGVFLMLDVSGRHNERGDALTSGASGGLRLQSGPVLVIYYENLMARAEYKYPLYEDVDGLSLSRGQEFNLGIGVAF